MRRNISLYIADQLVDLDENSFILFNYTQEDLSNPTIVKNSFSKQVTLNGTANNSKIFGEAFRLDRKTEYGESYTGPFFDATRKTPFKIYNEMNEVVESGYVKLDEVIRGKIVQYKITLYGGLGSFFYGLMYDEEGEKKNLTSMKYKWLDGIYRKTGGDFGGSRPKYVISDCWHYLKNPNLDIWATDIQWMNVINFAPCYNGLPSDFSADKFIIKKGVFENIKSFNFKEGTSSNLVVMTNPHTEWEMRDLRWYLQRPIFSIRAIFDAICNPENNGGYEVILHKDFFNENNKLYWDGWITLPMIPTEDRSDPFYPLEKSLKSTLSPADYLIGFAKIFGLVYQVTPGDKKVVISHRSTFFSQHNDIIDLTDRIDVSNIVINHAIADSRIYQFGGESQGEWAENYKKEFGRDYGIQRVNTGNEFNTDTNEVTNDLIFKDAIEVQERSLLYYTNALGRDEMGGLEELFYLPKYEKVTLQEWSIVDGEEQMNEVNVECPYEWLRFPFNQEYPLADFTPKVQFHAAENKGVSGENVLLVFNGVKDCPQYNVFGKNYGLTYRVTEDTLDMLILNENVPCWNLGGEETLEFEWLPTFRRCHTIQVDGEEKIDASFEWGESFARGVYGVSYDSADPATLYNRWWRKYQSDRYDNDTYRMSCKVNLKGLKVDQSLLSRFFYYQGAIFCLNKITNYSLTTYDDTECEFIRVQEISNYQN